MFIVIAACGAAAPARAQQDVGGAKDHPLFPRVPGYYIIDDESGDGYAFDVNKGSPQQINGKFLHLSYKVKSGAAKVPPQQIGRAYTDVVVKRDGTLLWQRFDASGGGATAVLAPAEAGDKGSVYVQVEVRGAGEYYDVYIVEETSTKRTAEFTAEQLADALKTRGRVVLHDLVFDAGKGSIAPASAAALATIASVLKGDPSLKLEIRARTDTGRSRSDNLTLSQARANVVKAVLVSDHGIADVRLATAAVRDITPGPDSVELIRR